MIGMNVFGGYTLLSVGMLWIGSFIFGPFGTALMPLRPFILEPDFDALAQGLFRSSSLAIPEHVATDLKQQTAIAPFTIRQQGQITGLLDDIAQELHRLFE